MLRLLKLELGKIFKPVITTTAILTVLTCILTCVLQRDYTVYFHIDAWEIGTEYIALLFPLFVTIPVCWQLYYERRDRFIVYTLSRISRQKYLSIKWAACALSGFCILFIPYVMSLLCALYTPRCGMWRAYPHRTPRSPAICSRNVDIWMRSPAAGASSLPPARRFPTL